MRVLVVDDYAPWRSYVRSLLARRAELHVVADVSDGLEAIQKAKELQPDLVLLDIGLPHLNGIEAARQIRKNAAGATILFVSENRMWDIAEEALKAGGTGYVVKSRAANELLPAVEAVLQGKRFVGLGLARQDGSTIDEHVADVPRKTASAQHVARKKADKRNRG